jgi:nucleoside phosphorylase
MSGGGDTLVCFAVPQERNAFRPDPGLPVRIVVSGMGASRARRTIEQALEHSRPTRVFTCGFAGGLDPSLAVGDVVFNTQSAPLAAALGAAGARPARFHCADTIAVTAEEKARLRASTRADAVEMESGIIQEVCARHSIPCATVRAISDPAHDSLPLDFNALLDAERQLSPSRLALAILRSPGRIPGLMRLGRQSSAAARRLAEVLKSVAATPG